MADRLITAVVFAAALTAVVNVHGSSQTPLPPGVPTPAAPPLPGGTGIIMGRVLDAASNQPVPSALVTLEGFSAIVPPLSLTDARGYFVVRELPAGRFTLSVQAAGYLQGRYGQQEPEGSATSLRLADGEIVADADIRVWKNAAISGTVFDEAGDPMVQVNVLALRRGVTRGRQAFRDIRTASTDDRGVFRLPALAPSEYVVALATGVHSMPAAVADAYLDARESNDPAALARLAEVANGLTLNASYGVAVGDQRVLAERGRAFVAPATADAPFNVYPTTFHPSSDTPSAAVVVKVASGEDREGVDIRTKAVPTRRVSGTVMGPAGPVPDATVRLTPAFAAEMTWSGPFIASTTSTDANGKFTLVGVTRGSYVVDARKSGTSPAFVTMRAADGALTGFPVAASAPGSTENPGNMAGSTAAEVGPDDVTGLTITMEPRVAVAGRVRALAFDPTAKPPVLSNVLLQLVAEHGNDAATLLRSNADGILSAPPVPKGRYLIQPAGLPPRWFLSSIVIQGRDVLGRAFDLTGDVSDADVTLVDRLPELSGTVTGSAGRNGGSAVVVIFPAAVQAWIDSGMADSRSRRVRTAPNGTFEIRYLVPGDYAVVALDGDTRIELQDPKDVERLARVATRVTLRDGEARTLTLPISRLP